MHPATVRCSGGVHSAHMLPATQSRAFIQLGLPGLHQRIAGRGRQAAALPVRRLGSMQARAEASGGSGGDKPFKKNDQFGYSRKDVILIGVGITGLGVGLYYGLQAGGMDAGMAGNWVQLGIITGMTFGWVGSYLLRVANKDMTYVKQLEDYEAAVMRKRWEEMPEGERERVLEEVEEEKARRAAKGTPPPS